MKRCPISYEPLFGDIDYSLQGLRLLDRKLTTLARLELTAEQQRKEALRRVGKMSVQGIQLKLSAVLRIKKARFEVVDHGGRFILKPPSLDFPQLPENEDVTMRMAIIVGIEVPVHGLIRAIDDSLTYFIKRFDRVGRERLPLEDFAQLLGESRETKYHSSMENVAMVVNQFCTFPVLEQVKLFTRTLFTFLVGNEDMHLKNFSLITRNGKVEFAPAYDFLNTTIALQNPKEELALSINGKKSRLTHKDLIDYFGRGRLQINDRMLMDILSKFGSAIPVWRELIQKSFLSSEMKKKYLSTIEQRAQRLRF